MEFNNRATHGASITDLYIEAAKCNEVKHGSDPNNLNCRIRGRHSLCFEGAPQQFELRIIHLIVATQLMSCMLFFLPLEDPRQFFTLTRSKLHMKLLQLKPGKALLNQAHPVCRDWDPELLGGGIRRMFAAGLLLLPRTGRWRSGGRRRPRAGRPRYHPTRRAAQHSRPSQGQATGQAGQPLPDLKK
jgi:hypothetical protein